MAIATSQIYSCNDFMSIILQYVYWIVNRFVLLILIGTSAAKHVLIVNDKLWYDRHDIFVGHCFGYDLVPLGRLAT